MGEMSDFVNEMQECDFFEEDNSYQYDFEGERNARLSYTGMSYQEEKEAMHHLHEEGFC